jgi:hypothetical protein
MLITGTEVEKEVLPEGETLRLNEWAEPAAWLLAGFAAFLGAFLLIVPASKPPRFDGPLRPVVGLIWLAIGLMIAGGARSGLIVAKRGITVQGFVRRSSLTWSQIAEFEIKQPFFRAALRIRLTDGSTMSAFGFSARSAHERRLAEARVTELNRRVCVSSSESGNIHNRDH